MTGQPVRTALLTLVEVRGCDHIRWFAGRVRVGESLACEECRADRTVTRAIPQEAGGRKARKV